MVLCSRVTVRIVTIAEMKRFLEYRVVVKECNGHRIQSWSRHRKYFPFLAPFFHVVIRTYFPPTMNGVLVRVNFAAGSHSWKISPAIGSIKIVKGIRTRGIYIS